MSYPKASTNLLFLPTGGPVVPVYPPITAIELEINTPLYNQLQAHVENDTDQDIHWVIQNAIALYLMQVEEQKACERRGQLEAADGNVVDITAKGA